MNVYADLIVADLIENKQVDTEKIDKLNELSVEFLYFSERSGTIYVYEPKNATPDYDFLWSIISELNVEDKNALTGEVKLSSSNTIFYTARKIDMGTADDYILLSTSMATVEDAIFVLRRQLFTAALIVIVVSVFISYVVAERISRPIDDMSAMANKWAKGDDTIRFSGGAYTEIDELANALNKAKTEVNKTTKLQRDLMANVSHDLKTPLTMIKAYAEMIKDISGNVKEKRDKHTQVIIDEADRLALLVNDILNLSKLQSEAEHFELKKVNLSVLIESVLYRFDAVVNEKGYKIEREIESNVFVLVDEKKIEEVIYNLVGNAINYSGEGKTIKVYLTKKEDDISLEIIDDGKGIDEEKIQTIWDRYLRYSETHKRTVKGTGLGLSIVKAILDAHNLDYGVVSKEGMGSNFYVLFKALPESVGGESDE